MTDTELISRIVAACGPQAVVSAEDSAGRPLSIQGDVLHAVPVLRPASTEDVATMMKLLHEAGKAVITIGGCTGLVGGNRPVSGKEWYLSSERMNAIELIDSASRCAVVQSGVILQNLHEAVADQHLLFPVDLGARGSATIGGMIATNAGGERVLRFGMMRDQVLGLEVVHADGTVLDLMDRVIKNNAGYDLRQLFLGSEGTLGIITRAVLRLRPAFASHNTALLALHSLDDIPAVLNRIEAGLGGTLSAFELMWPDFFALMTGGSEPRHRSPVRSDAAAYLLIDAEGGDAENDAARFMNLLESLLENGVLADAAIPQSEREKTALWAIRNDIPHLFDSLSPMLPFDISVPIAQMVSYADAVRAELTARWPAVRCVAFGHVADNNLHFGITIGEDTPNQAKAISAVVYAGIRERHGSISAEHGIGLDKRSSLEANRPPEVIALMRTLKRALDPNNLLNPGKLV